MADRAPINLTAALARLEEAWSPRTIASVNDYDVRVFKARGEFTRHTHHDTDEFFLVIEGQLRIRLDDRDVDLGPGDVFVVPRGTAHQPMSTDGASGLLLEPAATVNTGDNPGPLTAESAPLQP